MYLADFYTTLHLARVIDKQMDFQTQAIGLLEFKYNNVAFCKFPFTSLGHTDGPITQVLFP